MTQVTIRKSSYYGDLELGLSMYVVPSLFLFFQLEWGMVDIYRLPCPQHTHNLACIMVK